MISKKKPIVKLFRVKYSTILMVLFILLLPPPYFLNNYIFNSVHEYIILVLFFIVMFFTIARLEVNMFLLLTFVFLAWNIFSSYFLANGVLDINNNLKIITLVLLINLFSKNHMISLLKGLSNVFSLYLTINLLTLLLFPDGLYLDNPRVGQYRNAWFLGIDNQFTYFILPGIIIAYLDSWFRTQRISSHAIFITIISLLTVLISSSATALITVIFAVVLLILILRKKMKFLFNFYSYAIFYIILWISVIKLRNIYFFETIIERFLDRDMTFSSRTVIWDRILQTIPISKWYGFGNNSYIAFTNREYRAHNIILQIIFDNGYISLFLFILILVLVGLYIQGNNLNAISSIFLLGIFIILLAGISESYRLNHLFLLLSLAYYFHYYKGSLNLSEFFNNVEGGKVFNY